MSVADSDGTINEPSAKPNEPASLTSFLNAFVRFRAVVFALVTLLFLISFNGQWRIGRDSSIYRQIGRNLLRSHQYVFRPKGQQLAQFRDMQDVVYPGLPLLLAGFTRIFGEGDLPTLVLMYGMALAIFWLTYKLCRMYLPHWVAVLAVALMSVNRIFIEQSNDIQSDLPFLLGLLVSLYGFERLRRAKTTRETVIVALAIVAPGLVFAASMRPTFWFLAVAWVAACLWGLIDGDPMPDGRRSRVPSAVALGTLVGLALMALALDPRTKGFHPLSGGYEKRLYAQFGDIGKLLSNIWHVRIPKTIEQHLPAAFFGLALKQTWLPLRIFTWAYSVMVAGAGIWLIRVNRLWGLLVIATIGSLIVVGDVPRYYMMILPLLLAGWLMFCYQVARRMNWFPYLPALAMLWGISIAAVPNWVRTLDFVREQRGLERDGTHKTFVEVYAEGKKVELVHIAAMIKAGARPGQRVIGPEPLVMTYVADRQVYGLEHFVTKRGKGWVEQLRPLKMELVVVPSGRMTVLYDKDPVTPMLLNSGVISPTRELGRTIEGDRLCEFEYVTRTRGTKHTKGSRKARTAATQAATAPFTGPTTR